jgi:4-amino-4-deoxy-L-arabinose transferase-like glycosyltransferase
VQGTRRAPSILIWILLGVLWLANLPLRPLFDPDEGRYAEIPREMTASGDWVTPHLNGLKYFEKPPLQYWATAAFYEVFGLHDWTSRLWSAALAFLCIPMVYFFSMRVGLPRDTSLIAAALLAINPYFAIVGQLNLLDQGFTFFLSAAVFAFALAQLADPGGRQTRNWMLVTWAALALAVLSKGIATLLLAGGTLAIYMAINRDAGPLKRLQLTLGLPLFLLITIPWFWLVQARNPEFAQFFFVHEHFARFLTNVSNREQPWWYFIVIVTIALLPVIWNVRHWKLAVDQPPRIFQAEKFLLIWCGVVFLLFSTSHSKLASYMLPMMPALAALLARSTARQASAFGRAAVMVLLFLTIAAIGVVIGGTRRYGVLNLEALTWSLVTLGLCMAFLLFIWLRRDANAATGWSALAALSIAGIQSIYLCYVVAYPARGATEIAALAAQRISASTDLYFVGHYRQSLTWYLRRKIPVYDYVGELEFGMQQSNTTGTMDRGHFLQRWEKDTDALAFIDLHDYPELVAAGMPGHEVARDSRSVMVGR